LPHTFSRTLITAVAVWLQPVSGGLVTLTLRFDSHRGPFVRDLQQVANLRCAQVNSASYYQRDVN